MRAIAAPTVLLIALPLILAGRAASAATAAPGAERLDVDVIVFEDGVPDSAAVQREMGVFPAVRRVESRYFAIGLRNALVGRGRFGVVRAVPRADEGAELTIDGSIVRSDGRVLTLALHAEDATGRPWIETSYSLDLMAAGRRASGAGARDGLPGPGGGGEPDAAAGAVADEPGATDPVLAPLLRRIVADLEDVLDTLGTEDFRRIRNVAQMRYAADLAPDQFSDYLSPQEDGRLGVDRLPARDDPMLDRVLRIRRRDLQLKDTVDEMYRQSYGEIREAYRLWRDYSIRQLRYVQDREARLSEDDSVRRRSTSYAGLRQSYENYRWSKVQEQTLRRLAARFDSEVSPTVQEVEGTVVELEGNIDAQYKQWREILRSIFELETGASTPIR